MVRLASLIFFESLVSPPRLILRFSNRSRLFSASFIARNSMILNVTKETHGNMWTKIIRNLEMKTERVCKVKVAPFLALVAKSLISTVFTNNRDNAERVQQMHLRVLFRMGSRGSLNPSILKLYAFEPVTFNPLYVSCYIMDFGNIY